MTHSDAPQSPTVPYRISKAMSLTRYLTRVIWLSAVPIVMLAVYLAVNHINLLQIQRDQEIRDSAMNLAVALDRQIQNNIGALKVLGNSVLFDGNLNLGEFYNKAKAFHETFGSHVILADLSRQMLLNTRLPLGTALPQLPRIEGRSAVETALDTDQPAVGDLTVGPVAQQPIVAIAIPLKRDNETKFILINCIEASHFQRLINDMAIPNGAILTISDSTGKVIARRSVPAVEEHHSGVQSSRHIVAKTTVSPWTVALDVPSEFYRAHITSTIVVLCIATLIGILTIVLGGRTAAHKISHALSQLSESQPVTPSRPVFKEVERVRKRLAETNQTRDAAVTELRESERRYRSLFENMLEGLAYCKVFFDADDNAVDWVYLDVNEAFYRLTRLKDVVGKKVTDLIPAIKQTTPEIFEIYGRVALTGQPERFEAYVQPLDIFFEISVFSPSREHFVAVFTNITDRKKSEILLRESEERYRTLFEKARDSIMVISLEEDNLGRIVACNQVASEIHGYEREELLGMKITDLDTPDSAAKVPERINRLLRGEWLQEEATHRKKDGTVFPIEISSSLIEFGNRKYALAIDRDISERKQAEREQEDLRAQLLQSQKMEAVGSLATGIAHDFNNLLAIIMGYASYLLGTKSEGSPEYHELEAIVRNSRNAADLVRRIIIFSRQSDLVPVSVNLNHKVEEVITSLAVEIPKGIEIIAHLAKDLASINADAGLMTRMISNLVLNAIESIPDQGSITVQTESVRLNEDYCRSHVGVNPGQHVLLKVKDTGRGIEKNLMDRIFDPFYSTKRRDYRKGTGLGLSVVEGIVKQHGGHITVVSEVGLGTTITIYLPVLDS